MQLCEIQQTSWMSLISSIEWTPQFTQRVCLHQLEYHSEDHLQSYHKNYRLRSKKLLE
jgi:hypothetical protein